MIRRLAVIGVVLALVCLDVHGQSLPGAPVRPLGPPPVGFLSVTPRTRGVLLGQVVDAATGRGVAKAIVRVTGQGIALQRMTDDKGRFYFTDVPDADLAITTTKTGFFDGAYGKHRADGRGVPLTMSNSQWITDLRLELFKAAAISGVVVDETNEPLPDMRVRAWRREYAEGREQLVPAGDATTDDEGMYRVFGLKPGDYILSVPSVQVTMPIDEVEGAAAAAAGQPPVVSTLMSLTRATAAGNRIVEPGGKYVLVAGRNVTPPAPGHGATFAYRTEFYPGFELPSDAQAISVGSGEDRLGVHFQLHLVPTHRVSGVVVGPTGPVGRQLLRMVLDGADDQGLGNEAATTITAQDGTFTFLNVPIGHYTVQVRGLNAILTAAAADVVRDVVDPAAASPSKAWGNVDVSVRDADVRDVIVSLRPGLRVTGHLVTDGAGRQPSIAQIGRAAVGLLPQGRAVGGALVSEVNSRAEFSFSDLMPGEYFVRIGEMPPGWSLKSVKSGGQDLLDRPLDLSDDADVVVTLTNRPTQLFGTVRDWRGVSAAGATILVLPPESSGAHGLNPNRLREARAATSGVYTISGLPAGDYDLVAIEDTAAEGWQDPRRIAALRAQATRVSFSDGEMKTVDLRLITKK